MRTDILLQLKNEIYSRCQKSTNKFGMGCYYHIEAVVKNAELLARKYGADVEIVMIAAWLHDIASITDYSLYENHHIYGAQIADDILTELDYDRTKIGLVQKCIQNHRGSVCNEKRSVEEMCVADADAISHFDSVPSLLYLAYSERKMNIEDGTKFVKEKLERSFNKLSTDSKLFYKEKYNQVMTTFSSHTRYERNVYANIQLAAKQTIEFAKQNIKPGMNLLEVRSLCEEKLLEFGADSFWYWDVGAFVFAGDETTVSVSGKQYVTSDRIISDNDIVTIDLSPQKCNIWGDYARTIVLENKQVVEDISTITNSEWKTGLLMEEELHKELHRFVKRDTTFEELYHHMNSYILEKGFINLDFMGNLGHSISKQKSNRIYIEKGNQAKLSSVKYFTFEPHISIPNSKYGYKKENIYFFDDDELVEL